MCSYFSPFFPISPCSYLFLLQASQFWYSAPKQDRTSMVPNSPSRCLRRKNTAQRCSEKVSMNVHDFIYSIFLALCSSSMFIGSLILTVPCNTPPPSQKSSRAVRLSLAPRKAGQAKKRQLRSEMLKTRQAFLHRHCSSRFYMVFACAYINITFTCFFTVFFNVLNAFFGVRFWVRYIGSHNFNFIYLYIVPALTCIAWS